MGEVAGAFGGAEGVEHVADGAEIPENPYRLVADEWRDLRQVTADPAR